jgi:hypothetical protein
VRPDGSPTAANPIIVGTASTRLGAEETRLRAEGEGRLEAVWRKIASMIRAIEDGLYQPSMEVRMAELEAEKAALEQAPGQPIG